MDWFYQVIVFGLCAFLMFVLSAVCAKRKRHGMGLAFGVLELISGVISSSAWAWALKVSGKTDWFLFGLFGYTPFALICIAMLAVGILCIAVNLRGLVKEHGKQKQ